MTAYYNEIDPHAAQWLRNLIAAGHIATGDVDERSITDVRADDLRGYRQCHFFAGIGGWSYALRLAGVPDDRPVWTGSCPCQPFSAAGAQRGSDDERHLWPAFFGLIRECRPATVIGEQVAGAAGLAWLDHVCADLEDAGYAAAAANLGAHSAGAPHMRQRLYWVADFAGSGLEGCSGTRAQGRSVRPSCDSQNGGMGHAESARSQGRWSERRASPAGLDRRQPGLSGDAWADAEWLDCTDGKARPTQRGIFPLADGLPAGMVRGSDRRLAPDSTAEGRVMRLRGYGNAIVPQLAAAFVRAAI